MSTPYALCTFCRQYEALPFLSGGTRGLPHSWDCLHSLLLVRTVPCCAILYLTLQMDDMKNRQAELQIGQQELDAYLDGDGDEVQCSLLSECTSPPYLQTYEHAHLV